ncbi:MAG: hypothetical protein IKO73_09275 [Bacteroidaceae bacterium]|nr:hypothetical protein [Bacteroidaceae bacterium]
MKKFINFCESKLHCWKWLIVYMALTLWNAPEWCFHAFWGALIAFAGMWLLIVLFAIFLSFKEIFNEKKQHK